MRSRDGNHTLTFTICTIILFSAFSLHADEYLISYRYVVKNAIIYNDSLEISRAMQKCSGTPSKKHISIFVPKKTSFQSFISHNNEKFIDFIHKLGLDVEYRSSNSNYQNRSTTILTLKTQCFKVDFNESFATITPLK